MSTAAHIIVTALLTLAATARVTRLVAVDDFPIGPLRDAVTDRWGDAAWLSRLLNCPWCVGVWVAAPATASAYAYHDHWWWQALAAWMGLSFAASALVVTTNR